MNRAELKNQLQAFLSTTFGHNLESNIENFLDVIELEHRKALRPLCVSLAQIGIGIIKCADDTIWVTEFETAVDRIFNELGLDVDSRDGEPRSQLEEFITLGDNHLWHQKLKIAKSKQPVQLELNLKNET